MKTEIRIFFTALMFYTRLPCPKWVGHHPEYMKKGMRYFPLIGWITGGIAAVVLAVGMIIFSLPVAVLFSMVASVLVTGAFHEDGFADVCDGFGGGWTREQILDIMKDSRIGAYGALGILLIVLLKLFLTVEMIQFFPADWVVISLLLVSSHALSRFFSAVVSTTHEYVRPAGDSKVKPAVDSRKTGTLLIGSVFGLFPVFALVFILQSPVLLLVFIPLILSTIWLGWFFNKRIGGYTGDCLGTVQQVTEVVFLASVTGIWKFI